MSTDRPAIRVLLVDDTPDIRLLIRTLLAERSDLEVVAEAGDGQQAIALAGALQPDVIVLDVAMPVMDGISALPKLREVAPDARVVMLSALPRDLQAPAALAAGAAAYVEKSLATDTLVNELLGGVSLLDAAVRALTVQVRETFQAEPGEVAAARRFVATALDSWQQSDLAETITLLLSELVTNAIIHAKAAPDVSVRLLPDRVHVEVTDTQHDSVSAKVLTSDATSGRGLALIDMLAMNWGNVELPGGKVVWFDVARGAA